MCPNLITPQPEMPNVKPDSFPDFPLAFPSPFTECRDGRKIGDAGNHCSSARLVFGPVFVWGKLTSAGNQEPPSQTTGKTGRLHTCLLLQIGSLFRQMMEDMDIVFLVHVKSARWGLDQVAETQSRQTSCLLHLPLLFPRRSCSGRTNPVQLGPWGSNIGPDEWRRFGQKGALN
jgi:hypothetical protein